VCNGVTASTLAEAASIAILGGADQAFTESHVVTAAAMKPPA
jgi:hypothetical protein